jgi:hypothetical protein
MVDALSGESLCGGLEKRLVGGGGSTSQRILGQLASEVPNELVCSEFLRLLVPGEMRVGSAASSDSQFHIHK